jgi:hypothetical protein
MNKETITPVKTPTKDPKVKPKSPFREIPKQNPKPKA